MLTGFQFKAALAISKVSIKELSLSIGLHPITLSRLKKNKNNNFINCHSKNLYLIQNYFEKRNIIFPNKDSIQLNTNTLSSGLTRFHIVAARIATGLNQKQMSDIFQISSGSISLLEKLDNTDLIENRKLNNLSVISFFERIGIVFSKDYTVSLTKDPEDFVNKTKMLLDTKKERI